MLSTTGLLLLLAVPYDEQEILLLLSIARYMQALLKEEEVSQLHVTCPIIQPGTNLVMLPDVLRFLSSSHVHALSRPIARSELS